MKIGVVYPQVELAGDPKALDQIGRAVEAMGYDHLVIYDHVVGAVHEGRKPPLWGPYNDRDPFHDPLVAFGYLAGITKRIELVTGVLILPQRQTVLVARQATDVDLLSGGRLCLGVGTGWNYVEYEALGQDFETRGGKLSEQIVYLRRLWREAPLTFSGEFDRIDRANIVPRPMRQIPIYCGGFSEPAYKRAANLADGFIFVDNGDGAVGWERMRQLLTENERPIAGFGAHCIMQKWSGSLPQETVDAVQRWRDAGGTHASVVTMGLKFKTPAQHIDYLAEVRERLRSS